MIHPKELSPVAKRLSRLPLAITVGGEVDIKAMSDCRERHGTFQAPDRDMHSDHAIVDGRVIGAGNAALTEWLTADASDEDTRGLACVKTKWGYQ